MGVRGQQRMGMLVMYYAFEKEHEKARLLRDSLNKVGFVQLE